MGVLDLWYVLAVLFWGIASLAIVVGCSSGGWLMVAPCFLSEWPDAGVELKEVVGSCWDGVVVGGVVAALLTA